MKIITSLLYIKTHYKTWIMQERYTRHLINPTGQISVYKYDLYLEQNEFPIHHKETLQQYIQISRNQNVFVIGISGLPNEIPCLIETDSHHYLLSQISNKLFYKSFYSEDSSRICDYIWSMTALIKNNNEHKSV